MWLALLAGVVFGLLLGVAVVGVCVLAANAAPPSEFEPASGLAPTFCEVVSAVDVRVGDLIDGWLRVDMVEVGIFEPDVIHVTTGDGHIRLGARASCFVLRAA